MSAGKTFPAVLTPPASEKEKKKRLPRQAIPSVPRNARHPGGNAPHRSTRRPEKFPATQRAGARRRSPQRGSAAAGAHIARVAGRCAPTCPLRRAADWVHVARQSLPPPHGQRGCTGVVGGVEGHAPLTPCRQPRRLPRPHAGLKPPASGRKIKKPSRQKRICRLGKCPMQKTSPVRRYPPYRGMRAIQGKMLPSAQRAGRKSSLHPSEPGRGGDPRNAGAPQQARISPA